MVEHKQLPIISGSTAARRKACPGSYHWEQTAYDHGLVDPPSTEAEIGTLLHEALEILMDDSREAPAVDCRELVATYVAREDLSEQDFEDLMGRVLMAFEAYSELIERYDIEAYDMELTYEHIKTAPGCGGTLDFVGVSRDGETVVFADTKFGENLKVYAKDNEQLKFYALGCYDNDDTFVQSAKKVVLAVVQPWVREGDEQPTLDVWESDIHMIEAARRAEIKAAADAAADKGKTTVPGAHCRFCKGHALCPSQNSNVVMFERTDISNIEGMNMDQLADLLEMGKRAKKQYDELQKLVRHLAARGIAPTGYKVVQDLHDRQWKNEQAAGRALTQMFAQEAYEKRLLSPAKAEKLARTRGVPQSSLQQLWHRPPRGVKTVKLSAKGDPISHGDLEGVNLTPLPFERKKK